jgi:hypothetical protein
MSSPIPSRLTPEEYAILEAAKQRADALNQAVTPAMLHGLSDRWLHDWLERKNAQAAKLNAELEVIGRELTMGYRELKSRVRT